MKTPIYDISTDTESYHTPESAPIPTGPAPRLTDVFPGANTCARVM